MPPKLNELISRKALEQMINRRKKILEVLVPKKDGYPLHGIAVFLEDNGPVVSSIYFRPIPGNAR